MDYKDLHSINQYENKQYKIKPNQQKKSLCKIITNKGTNSGFLCQIPATVLITNNSTLSQEDIKEGKEIKVSFNNGELIKNILIDEKRNTYTNKETDITIIEINPEEDGLSSQEFLEIDENLNEDFLADIYEFQEIYIIQYSLGVDNVTKTTGMIKRIHEKSNNICDFEHTCFKKKGSIGNPIILFNDKVIGIEKQCDSNSDNNLGKGVLLNYAIKKYKEKNKNKIFLILFIDKNDVNKEIYFLDNTEDVYFEDGKYIKHHHDNLKELKDTNTLVYINNKKQPFKKFFIPNKEGQYKIELIFKNKVKNCQYMFNDCKNIIDIDLSFFYTQNTNNMRRMFCDCVNLENINISNINTQNVTNMERMFCNCKKLPEINLLNFDTQNVTKMDWMFRNCEKLTNLNLENFDTQNVINMEWMFSFCENLTEINIMNFDTKNVQLMGGMFCDCKKLSNINLSYFDTKKVINMANMFIWCENLVYIDVTGFDTENVKNMGYMFNGCKNLKYLDLSYFKIKNETGIVDMFAGCKNLAEIRVNSKEEFDIIKKIVPATVEVKFEKIDS